MAKTHFPKGLGSKPKYDESRKQWTSQLSVGVKKNGKRNRRTVRAATQPELLAKLQALRQETVDEGALREVSFDTVGAVCEAFLEHVAINRQPKTLYDYRNTYKNVIKPLVGKIRAERFTLSDAADFIRDLQTVHGRSACQANKAYVLLSSAFKMALKEKRAGVRINPMSGTTTPTYRSEERKFLSTEAQRRYVAAALAHKNLTYRALLLLALDTGARSSELFALEWSDLNLANAPFTVRFSKSVVKVQNVVYVQRTKTPSGKRTVPISATTAEALNDLHKVRLESPIVFQSPRSKPDSYLDLQRFRRDLWAKFLPSAGIEYLNFHSIRHTTASRWIAQNVPMFVIAKWLGHKDVTTTMRFYAHLMEEQTTLGTDGFDALAAPQANPKVVDLASRREGTSG